MEIVRRALGLPPERYAIDDRIKELNYGHWEGMLQDDLPMIDPHGLAMRSIDPFRWRPDHGESYADLLVRVIDWFGHRNGLGRRRTRRRFAVPASACARPRSRSIPDLESPQDKVLVLTGEEMKWL